MTKEKYEVLGSKLAAAYKVKARTSKSKGVGLIRAIIGLSEDEQGYLHLEEFYIRGDKITLGNYLNALEAKLEASSKEIEGLSNKLTSLEALTEEKISELVSIIETLKNEIKQLKIVSLD